MDAQFLDWIIVAFLGGIVGASELISRYRDAPVAALHTIAAYFYIGVNVAASVAALFVIHHNPTWFPSRITQITMAGIGSMALFRSSLFIIRAGDKDVGVGPSGFLQIFLGSSDRAVDRHRASVRSNAVGTIMTGVDYTKAYQSLPPYCLALMQNVSPDDQQALARALQVLNQGNADPEVKARLLGLELLNLVGVDVLTAAVKALHDQIRIAPPIT